jgi:two-component system, NtrC family, sensor kinase
MSRRLALSGLFFGRWRGMGRAPLRLAVVLAVSLGLLGPGLFSVWRQVQFEERAAESELRNDVGIMTDVLGVAMRDPLWQVSPEQGRLIGHAAFRDPRLVSVVVRSEDDKVFFELYRSVSAMAPLLAEQRPVVMGDRKIGTITLALSTGAMQDGLRGHLRELLLHTALALVFSLAFILWVLERWVLGPIAYVTRAASELAERRLDSPVALDRADELGALAGALEHMRCSLQSSFSELERKNIELQAYASTLESRVEQRTLDLTETNERLSTSVSNLRAAQRSLIESEKLASLGRLVASIAHELNTPLGNAMTVVSALEESHREFSEKAAAGPLRRSELDRFMAHNGDGLDILHRNVSRSASLIASFKQVAVDQSSERRRIFDLSVVVQETISTIQPKLKRTPYLIQNEMALGILMDSYPGPLEQVLINLIMNSVVHGFGERPYGVVTLRSERLGKDRVRIVCADDGVGMDEKVRARIFEPFFTTKAGSGGSGLGMSIVYSIVSSVLGGRISLQSKPGEGTACVIDLPLKAPEHQPGEDGAQ